MSCVRGFKNSSNSHKLLINFVKCKCLKRQKTKQKQSSYMISDLSLVQRQTCLTDSAEWAHILLQALQFLLEQMIMEKQIAEDRRSKVRSLKCVFVKTHQTDNKEQAATTIGCFVVFCLPLLGQKVALFTQQRQQLVTNRLARPSPQIHKPFLWFSNSFFCIPLSLI